MPNGMVEGHDVHDSEICDLQKKIAELEALIKAQQAPNPASQDKMLMERTAKYGPFDKHAITVQAFWRIMAEAHNAGALEDIHKEGLRMIFHKIGRIVTGDPMYPDSWDDIAGYAKRVADYCRHKASMQAQSGSRAAIDPTTGEKFNPSGKIPLVSEGEKDAGGGYT